MRKTILLFLIAATVFGLAACGNNAETPESAGNIGDDASTGTEVKDDTAAAIFSEPNPFAGVEIGDVVSFGSYEQDADMTNGPEPVDWLVLDKKDGKVLILSKYGLDCKPYHSSGNKDVTWESCTLRTWLNHDFLNTAFTAEERTLIACTTLVNEDSPVGGSGTDDYVFLLSVDELMEYFAISDSTVFCGIEFSVSDSASSLIGACSDLVCLPTRYAFSQGCLAYKLNLEENALYPYTTTNKDESEYDEQIISCEWFLRTPGYGNAGFLMVDGAGMINKIIYSSSYNNRTTRPAMWVSQ